MSLNVTISKGWIIWALRADNVVHSFTRFPTQAPLPADENGNPQVFSLDLGMCVTPETKVLSRINGSNLHKYNFIKNLNVGDMVFTHEGIEREILKVFVRKIDEEIVKLHLHNGEIIQITINHPILTTKGWIAADNLTKESVLYRLSDVSINPLFNQKGSNRWDNISIKGICLDCDKEFVKRRTGLNQKYCSRLCQNRYQAKDPEMKRKRYSSEKWKIGIHNRKGKILSDKQRKDMSVTRIIKGVAKGSNNPNWRDGIGNLPWSWEFNKDLKEIVRNTYNRKCFICGKNENELTGFHKRLFVHHIDYDKMSCKIDNLVPLCISCHGKTSGGNRKYWSDLLKAKVLQFNNILTNGMRIVSIEREFYSGLVYDLEVDKSHSFCGKGIIFHNSLEQVSLQGTVNTVSSGTGDPSKVNLETVCRTWWAYGDTVGDLPIVTLSSGQSYYCHLKNAEFRQIAAQEDRWEVSLVLLVREKVT